MSMAMEAMGPAGRQDAARRSTTSMPGGSAATASRAARWTGFGRAILLGIALAFAAPVAGALPASADARLVRIGGDNQVDAIRVTMGKSETVRIDGTFADLVVGDPEVADVVPLTDRTLYVLGKKIGSTNVTVYDAKKQLLGVVEVEVAYDASRLATEIRRRVPSANIQVTTANGRIVLSGTVRDAASLDRAVAVAKQFSPDVINSLSVGSAQQVMLEVRFVEASRSAGRDIGINWGVHSSQTGFAPGGGQGPGIITVPGGSSQGGLFAGAAELVSGKAPFGVVVAQLLGNGISADMLIRGLEERGIARRLAEPNLVALSGDTASFLAGGEYPVPVSGKDNVVTIEYKQFGVSLAFTPTVLDRGLINIKIAPEVSELDYSNPVVVGGVSVPSVVVRRANTTVELRDGQSFAVAGLLQNTNTTNLEQYPWLGSVPVLGALFRSSSYQKKETELVIIVTPRLVRPMIPGQMARTPLDGLAPANDADLFLNGKGEVTAEQIRFVEAGGTKPALTGHMIEAPKTALVKGAAHVAAR